MSFFKVWRGFNGNIYFEPIVCNTLSRSLQFKTNSQQIEVICAPDLTDQAKIQLNENEKNLKVPETELSNNPQSSIKNRSLSPSIFPILPNTTTTINVPTSAPKDIDAMSTSTVNGGKTFIKFSNNSSSIKTKVASNNSPNMFTNKDLINLKELTSNNNNININNLNPNERFRKNTNAKQILPNLNAVKKQNSPIRGLAYREVKSRIATNDPIQENTANKTHNSQIDIERRLFNSSLDLALTNNSETFGPKPTYKEMLKGIKRGVTVNNQFIKIQESKGENNVKFIDIKHHEHKSSSPDEQQTTLNSNEAAKSTVRRKAKKIHSNILNIKGDKLRLEFLTGNDNSTTIFANYKKANFFLKTT